MSLVAPSQSSRRDKARHTCAFTGHRCDGGSLCESARGGQCTATLPSVAKPTATRLKRGTCHQILPAHRRAGVWVDLLPVGGLRFSECGRLCLAFSPRSCLCQWDTSCHQGSLSVNVRDFGSGPAFLLSARSAGPITIGDPPRRTCSCRARWLPAPRREESGFPKRGGGRDRKTITRESYRLALQGLTRRFSHSTARHTENVD